MLKKMVSKVVSILSAAVMIGTMSAAAISTKAEEAPAESYEDKIKEIAIMVNEARAEYGLKPIYVVPYLCEVAEIRAEECSEEFSHKRADGSRFETVLDTEIVPYSFAAENIAAGSEKAVDTFNQWKGSAGHWAAILTPEITHMGIGMVYEEDSQFGYYWQQIFVQVDKEYADQYIPTEEEIVPKAEGDVNGDGIVNSYDYLELTEYITKKKNNIPVYFNQAQLETADCFQDGIITESDAKVMVRYLLGEYKSLPFVF